MADKGDSREPGGTGLGRVKPALPVRWTSLRPAVQAVVFLLFLVLFVWSRRGGWSPALVNIPMRIDVLAVLASLLASRAILAGSAVALILVVLTLLLGRVWCGWLCPMGSLLDWLPLRRWSDKRADVPDAWRGVKHTLLITILVAAAFANLTLMVFDPLTILFRTLSSAVWPALDQVVSAAEAALYDISFIRPGVAAFDRFARPMFLPIDPILYRYTLLYAGVFFGVIGLNLVAPRFWCRYLCPLGGMLGLMSKVALLQRKVNGRCTQCSACASVCPTGTIQSASRYSSESSECTMCLACWAVCPADAIHFRARISGPTWAAYDPDRRQLLTATSIAIAGVGLFRADLLSSRDHTYLLRPPGASANDLLAKCIRCGECNRACPTGAIQPSVIESGVEGLWTPILLPRAGYCDYSCNACGQVCPVQAIPPLRLEEKRQRIIGHAYIDENRCIPWADREDCIICEEMCPVPEKAILLEEVERQGGDDGKHAKLKRPRVVRERCIGCGICEYKCPVKGEAAIRVRVPQERY